MRLAIDASNLARDRRGMGRLARPVVRAALDDPAFDVTLLADRDAEVRALRAEFPNAAVRASASARSRGRYDIVWFPFNGIRYPVAAPSLVSMADAFAFTEAHPDPIARYREQAPIRRAARRASRIVTLSAWSRAEIAREVGLDPADIDVVAPAPDAFWSPGSDDVLPDGIAGRRFALLVGAREPRKNARLALEACAGAFLGSDDLLVIVGELGEADRAFARSCGLRCGEIAASDAVLRALYRNAAAVLVPSLAEGFGLVAVEAMACGAPVLAANASALPEATGGAAELLDPNDPMPWALALRDLLDDDARRAEARKRGLAYVAHLDRSAPVTRVLGLLRELGGTPANA